MIIYIYIDHTKDNHVMAIYLMEWVEYNDDIPGISGRNRIKLEDDLSEGASTDWQHHHYSIR